METAPSPTTINRTLFPGSRQTMNMKERVLKAHSAVCKWKIVIIWSRWQRGTGWGGEIPFCNLCPKYCRHLLSQPQGLSLSSCLSSSPTRGMLCSVAAQSSLAEASILGNQWLLLAPCRGRRIEDWGARAAWGSEQRLSLGTRYSTYSHPAFPSQLWVLPHSPANTSSVHSRGSSMVPAQSSGRSCWKSPSMQAASYISVAAPSRAHPCPSQLPHGGTLFLIPVSSNGGILLFLFLIPIFF